MSDLPAQQPWAERTGSEGQDRPRGIVRFPSPAGPYAADAHSPCTRPIMLPMSVSVHQAAVSLVATCVRQHSRLAMFRRSRRSSSTTARHLPRRVRLHLESPTSRPARRLPLVHLQRLPFSCRRSRLLPPSAHQTCQACLPDRFEPPARCSPKLALPARASSPLPNASIDCGRANDRYVQRRRFDSLPWYATPLP